MTIDTNTMISITEANQNFSKVTRVVDEHGTAVILKNNVPRYLVIDFSKAEQEKIASTEDVLAISERLIKQNMEAYEVLAKHLKTYFLKSLHFGNFKNSVLKWVTKME